MKTGLGVRSPVTVRLLLSVVSIHMVPAYLRALDSYHSLLTWSISNLFFLTHLAF